MTLESQFLLIFSGFGSLNGILISGYVFITSKQKLAQKFLALMLLMISIRIFKSVLFFFNPEVDKLILQIGLSSCFLIGPFLYFYVKALSEGSTNLPTSWRIHIALLLLLVVALGLLFPYAQYINLWGSVIYKAVNYIWLIYLLLSWYVSKPNILILLTKSKQKLTEDDILLCCVLVGNSAIWLAYFTASYTSYIFGAFSFIFVFILTLLLLFFKFNSAPIKYGDNKIEDTEADISLSKLETLMAEQKLFNNPNITMPQIAKRIGMSSPKFSQLLNDKLNKSFSVYINELRIAQAQQLLIEHPKQKLDLIAEQCGFNSPSTFYSVFKKHSGLTPAKYRIEHSLK
jgi:AraC-like DNA-binding protein